MKIIMNYNHSYMITTYNLLLLQLFIIIITTITAITGPQYLLYSHLY